MSLSIIPLDSVTSLNGAWTWFTAGIGAVRPTVESAEIGELTMPAKGGWVMSWFGRRQESPEASPAEQSPEKVANLVAQCIGLGAEIGGAGGAVVAMADQIGGRAVVRVRLPNSNWILPVEESQAFQ